MFSIYTDQCEKCKIVGKDDHKLSFKNDTTYDIHFKYMYNKLAPSFELSGDSKERMCGFVYEKYDRLSTSEKDFIAVTKSNNRFGTLYGGFIGV